MSKNNEQNNIKTSEKVRKYCVKFMSVSLAFFVISFLAITINFGETQANTINGLIATVITVLLVGLFDVIDFFKEDERGKTEYEDQKLKSLTKGIMMVLGSVLPIVYGVFSLGRFWGIFINCLVLLFTIYGICKLRKI